MARERTSPRSVTGARRPQSPERPPLGGGEAEGRLCRALRVADGDDSAREAGGLDLAARTSVSTGDGPAQPMG